MGMGCLPLEFPIFSGSLFPKFTFLMFCTLFLGRGRSAPLLKITLSLQFPRQCSRLFRGSRPFRPPTSRPAHKPIRPRPLRNPPRWPFRPRPLPTPAHVGPRPPLLRPKSYFDLLSHPEGAPKPCASTLTGPRAPGPPRPSLGRQSRSLSPSRRHLAPTPSALRLCSASCPSGFKGTDGHPALVAGHYLADSVTSPLSSHFITS